MESVNKLESGFQIKNLLLLESSFSRINNVRFGENIKSDLNINTEVSVKEKVITVVETVSFDQKNQETEQVKIMVKMVGVFECIGNSDLKNYDEFGKVNGAAIIFPYIREHITNLSLKAGIGPVVLPPINFTSNKKNS